jgi:hypothetical protein
MRINGRLAIFLLLASALKVSVPSQCPAQEAATIKVDFARQQSYVVLQVSGLTNLAAVLEEFCKSTRTACEGMTFASKITVLPTEIRGSWTEVLSKLMEGTHLNFAALVPHGDHGGKLLIMGFGTPLDKTGSTNGRPALFVENGLGRPQPEGNTGSNASTAEIEPVSMASSGELASGNNAATPASAQGQQVQQEPSTAALPFPDSSGNPKAAQNAQPGFLPFPDSNGNPKPVSNGPAQFFPFPDSNGKSIPVRPGASGSPFPNQAAASINRSPQ